MTIPEVLDIFEDYTSNDNIPSRFIDLERLCLVDIDAIRDAHRPAIESIEEADIERHTSYANQRREDVIRTIVKGVVKYAILSHTWRRGLDRFRYRDMVSNAPRIGAGWHKLERFCEIAKTSFRCRFAWADIICIDYRNPSDRQTATQSLFDWYRNAYVCIAYLASASDPLNMGHDAWFYRGFTLPELLAPMRMKFYGDNWKALNNDYIENDKADETFLDLLSKASGIPADDLRTFWPGPDRIRHKLSWASRRDTTTVEDKAYSLMAIFDSRIPVHYGPDEGEKAFIRLMIDVIPRSGECDVFAWAGPHSRDHPGLPPSPAGFREHHRHNTLDSTPHRYRLCGDRSLSINLDRLRMRVVILEINLPPEGVTSFKPAPRMHSASVGEVTPVDSGGWAALHLESGARMALGVIDYHWTSSPDRGKLLKDHHYFCFFLYTSTRRAGWKKVPTRKVVLLSNDQELVRELDLLDI